MAKTLDEILEEQMGAGRQTVTPVQPAVTFHEMEAFARKMMAERDQWKSAAQLWRRSADIWTNYAQKLERQRTVRTLIFYAMIALAFFFLGTSIYLLLTRH